MAILGVWTTANSYLSRRVNGAKATTLYPGTQPGDKTDQAQERPIAPGNDQTAAQALPDEPEPEREDNLKLSDNGMTTNVNKFEITTSKPSDNSSELIKRLVAATGQFEVRQVISEANKHLMGLRMIAAAVKGEDAALARSYIKKIEKLLTRASRKLEDLDKEDMLKLQQVRAEQRKQKQRVEEIKTELRKKQNERRARENGYLLEDLQAKTPGTTRANNNNPATNQNVASEAAIAAQAEAIAAAEMAVGSSSSSASTDGGVSSDVSGEPSPGADSGAAAASAEGGGESA